MPLPSAVSRGDQIKNLEVARSADYSTVLGEDELNADVLTQTVQEVFSTHRSWLQRLSKFESKDALGLIVSEIERAIANS